MAQPYGEVVGDEADDAEACIVGQVSGPRSWSEYVTPGDGSHYDPSDQFHRRNGTCLPQDIPDPRAGRRS